MSRFLSTFKMPLMAMLLSLSLTGVFERCASAEPAPRVALVIGNSNYSSGRLQNPVNDARAIAEQLKNLGFYVETEENLDHTQMSQKVFDFYHNSVVKSALRVIYYAGHGAEYEGRNYLIPTDSDITQPEDFPRTAFPLDDLRKNLDTLKQGVSVLILDTCRIRTCPTKRCRGVLSTLGFRTEPKSSGTLIAYSTSFAQPAGDGLEGGHSMYTGALLKLLEIPSLPVEKLFKRLTEEVYVQSNQRQRPEFVDGLIGEDVCFNGGPLGQCGN